MQAVLGINPICSLSVFMGGLCGFSKYNNKKDVELTNVLKASYLLTSSFAVFLVSFNKTQITSRYPTVIMRELSKDFVSSAAVNALFFCLGHHTGLAADKIYLRLIDDMRLLKYSIPTIQNQQLDAVKVSDNIV